MLERAQALRWMFFEQYSHEPYVAVARFICGWTPIDSPRRADLPRLRERAHEALAVMERHLAGSAWFTGAQLRHRRHRVVSPTPMSPTTAACRWTRIRPSAPGAPRARNAALRRASPCQTPIPRPPR